MKLSADVPSNAPEAVLPRRGPPRRPRWRVPDGRRSRAGRRVATWPYAAG